MEGTPDWGSRPRKPRAEGARSSPNASGEGLGSLSVLLEGWGQLGSQVGGRETLFQAE